MREVKLRMNWDNFRSRDASVFRFYFNVSEDYFSHQTLGMALDGSFSASNPANLSGYAKYTVMKATEDILSNYTGRKVIVADPEKAAKRQGGRIPGTKNNLFHVDMGFLDMPNWTKGGFLKYDDSVPKIIQIKVQMTKRSGNLLFLEGLHYTRPICKIVIKVYNRDKKKLETYRYTKREFKKLTDYHSNSVFFDYVINSVWNTDIKSGAPIPYIVSFYLQTLEELVKKKDFKLYKKYE